MYRCDRWGHFTQLQTRNSRGELTLLKCLGFRHVTEYCSSLWTLMVYLSVGRILSYGALIFQFPFQQCHHVGTECNSTIQPSTHFINDLTCHGHWHKCKQIDKKSFSKFTCIYESRKYICDLMLRRCVFTSSWCKKKYFLIIVVKSW